MNIYIYIYIYIYIGKKNLNAFKSNSLITDGNQSDTSAVQEF